MKRNELTVDIMKDRRFEPVNNKNLTLENIVHNIQENGYWKYLRCRIDESETYSRREYGMCATYEIYSHKEYLEYSADKNRWFPVAYRFVEFNRRCVYAD